MDIAQARATAKRQVEVHGWQAEAEAAQKLQEFEGTGDTEQAEKWRRIRSLIREMKPPHES